MKNLETLSSNFSLRATGQSVHKAAFIVRERVNTCKVMVRHRPLCVYPLSIPYITTCNQISLASPLHIYILQVIKDWSLEQPGDKATLELSILISSYSVQHELVLQQCLSWLPNYYFWFTPCHGHLKSTSVSVTE